MKRSQLATVHLPAALAALLTLLVPGAGLAAGGAGPDLAVADLFQTRLWGEVDGIVAYSLGTEICNLGDVDAQWIADTNDHPVIAQNMYRLENGRMEQIGMSWLKHGFNAVNGEACGVECQHPGSGDELGPGCSDPYDAGLNGDQGGFGKLFGGGLGPRSEVNAASGQFLYPYGDQGETGDAIYKRLQVAVADIDPAAHPDAAYFIEGHYVTADDAQSGNGGNNASYREVLVNENLTLSLAGATVQTRPAILAWQDRDPEVRATEVEIPGDGRVTVASRATDLGGGRWHYEYAVHNLDSHRSGGAFRVVVPAGATISNLGFHDVDYHSGEPYSGADWPASPPDGEGGPLIWATDAFDVDPDANALRWGTTYNFRFDADAPPADALATLGLFRPGTPGETTAAVVGPFNGQSCGGATDLALAVDPLVRGEPADLVATGADPGSRVFFLGGLGGQGCGLCPDALGGLCLDLLPDNLLLGSAVADAAGAAVLTITVPPGLGADVVTAQAVTLDGAGGGTGKSGAVDAAVEDPLR